MSSEEGGIHSENECVQWPKVWVFSTRTRAALECGKRSNLDWQTPAKCPGHVARAGQTTLDVHPASDCLVYVENKRRRIFIRRGLNQNQGSPQKEVFILHKDGSIEGAINWDYEEVTRVEARPIDKAQLRIHGGVFTDIANRVEQDDPRSVYWGRNIVIRRSNTVVEGVTQHVTGETDVGQPYHGFLEANTCGHIELRDCVVDGRKTYVKKAGSAGKPVAMGSYGYGANLVAGFHMIGCRMGTDIRDRSRWGVIGTNFMKNFVVEKCTLSRVDVHQGVTGTYIIRDSTLGHSSINAIGSGSLVVENTTLYGRHLISFREDYGSTWDGDVLIRNCRWLPPLGRHGKPVMFGMHNDGKHDFGYPCSMPHTVRIDGLFVGDASHPGKGGGFVYFQDPGIPAHGKAPYPYRLTQKLEVHGLKTASDTPPVICTNPKVAQAVRLIRE